MTRHFFPLMLLRMPSRSFCDCSLRAARLSGALSRLGICAICPGLSWNGIYPSPEGSLFYSSPRADLAGCGGSNGTAAQSVLSVVFVVSSCRPVTYIQPLPI
uniref:Similar to ATVPS33 (Arabidopsis thaliana vacuolar protein sorting 33) n=1 Tax=Arundo donax TaxID=35708 RepID=A0A0A9DDJ0_ARUDO